MKEKPILKSALDAATHQSVAISRYLELISASDPEAAPLLNCPVCGEGVHLTRTHDRTHTPYFIHTAGEHAQCPLVNRTLPVTSAFTSIYPYDAGLGRQRRSEFAKHWRHHLAEIRRHAPHFTVLRFTHGLAQADVLHIWSCPSLTQLDIPYILMVLSAFIVENPRAPHPTWLRFVFDASVLDISDLRRTGPHAPRLFRLHYRASHHSMFPNASHLLDWAEVPMSREFLRQAVTNVMATEFSTFAEFMDPQPRPEPGTDEIRPHRK